MVKFGHLADVHLGGWRQEPMQDLNFKSFQYAVKTCIEKKVDFVLIAGDLFDTAYPPIEILKETFAEFKKLKDANIPVFLIAGSHDFSVSGKSFLDVLEKAGFCKNVFDCQKTEENLILNPTVHKGIAFYGYPGKKSGLEVEDIKKIKLNESPGMFKILMLHTTLDKVRGVLPIPCVEADSLPKADYYALGHIHVDFRYKNLVYPGPVFPNNFQELETLHNGSFYLIDTDTNYFEKVDIKLKGIESLEVRIKNATTAADEIIDEFKKRDLQDKIVLLRISGELENQKTSDLKLDKIEEFCINSGAYFVLKNTHDLKTKQANLEIEITNKENLEEESIDTFAKENPSNLNESISDLINALSIEKQEGETVDSFSKRLIDESKKVLKI
jgi:exonuclease SbcD